MGYPVRIWGVNEELTLYHAKYANNGNLAVVANDKDGFPYAAITVNLVEWKLDDNCAYVDTNNCPWAEDFLRKYDIAYPTGDYRISGFCVYPMYLFSPIKLKRIGGDD